ncbi:6849_t:CDS:2 [Racocetra fulgida]|uniref:6849_t:CDS:1 n=1 Tax=Racocetra fulgida TaxID=60492 RepID=A0A9N9FDZ6_9GLOM|nr:6849_t:CDS:2 [Racocetra fulgida]
MFIGIFAFDNAISHIAFAKDAFVFSRINLYSGGFVLKMAQVGS